ncbi:hypothetical protein DUE52_29200 [Larkinella punicea]|uniref:Uncharacterized protein n=1 Tax=Larkinella punicea TaxID=2315727 RepID=A0A368JDZ9_9BACT|nr:hypothetical protein DUE52_29200 [Larkinella punicea]
MSLATAPLGYVSVKVALLRKEPMEQVITLMTLGWIANFVIKRRESILLWWQNHNHNIVRQVFGGQRQRQWVGIGMLLTNRNAKERLSSRKHPVVIMLATMIGFVGPMSQPQPYIDISLRQHSIITLGILVTVN